MKKLVLAIICSTFLLLANNVQAQENEKVEKARKEVLDANKNLNEAKKDSANDFNEYRKEAEKKIAENKVKIAQLKSESPKDNSNDAAKFKKKVLALEQRNNELKRRIQKAKYTKQTTWIKFKDEFKHDMDGLGKSISDIFKSNTN
ncbi:MAG: hypothetical protein ACOVMI_04170 [Chitinophagaceae bacterium]